MTKLSGLFVLLHPTTTVVTVTAAVITVDHTVLRRRKIKNKKKYNKLFGICSEKLILKNFLKKILYTSWSIIYVLEYYIRYVLKILFQKYFMRKFLHK